MTSRLELQALLEKTLGSRNVYYQPPPSVSMKYPAIRYSRDQISTIYANNKPYISQTSYQLVVIDANPDSNLVDKIAKLPECTFNRHYTADGLNHDVFTIHF